jgi:hypothetical protein
VLKALRDQKDTKDHLEIAVIWVHMVP